MSEAASNNDNKPIAVVIGATSKWQSDGRNTRLAHGGDVSDAGLPLDVRWGVGGAISLRFARAGFHVVLTTRSSANAIALLDAIQSEGGTADVVELDLTSETSINLAFEWILREQGVP